MSSRCALKFRVCLCSLVGFSLTRAQLYEAPIAIQSATSSNGVYPAMLAALAIDGIAGNDVEFTPYTCYHSGQGTAAVPASLTLDLGYSVSIGAIALWPRTSCCLSRNLNWQITVGNSTTAALNPSCTVPYNVTPSPLAPTLGRGTEFLPYNTTISCSANGRYVIITLPYNAADPSQSFLQLCEVMIFAPPK